MLFVPHAELHLHTEDTRVGPKSFKTTIESSVQRWSQVLRSKLAVVPEVLAVVLVVTGMVRGVATQKLA